MWICVGYCVNNFSQFLRMLITHRFSSEICGLFTSLSNLFFPLNSRILGVIHIFTSPTAATADFLFNLSHLTHKGVINTMKLVCSKSNLLKSVNIVLKAIPGKTTMPILECILIDASTNNIKWKKELLQLMQKFSLISFVNFLIMMLRLKQTEI